MSKETKAAHTPGPLRVGRVLMTPVTRRYTKAEWDAAESRERLLVFAGFTGDDDGRGRQLVADCTGSRVYASQEEAEANTRLFAAAPELLTACKKALREVDPDGLSGPLLRAAIAKATTS